MNHCRVHRPKPAVLIRRLLQCVHVKRVRTARPPLQRPKCCGRAREESHPVADTMSARTLGVLSLTIYKTRRGRITFVELLVIIVVLGMLATLLIPATGSRPPLTDEDLNLDDWEPDPEHTALPADSIRVRAIDLEGVWSDRIGWHDVTIKSLAARSEYNPSFLSHGRCALGGSVELERLAKYEDGVLLMDRPVQELTGATYKQLFSVRVNETICLVPSVRVADVAADTSEIPYRGVFVRDAQQ